MKLVLFFVLFFSAVSILLTSFFMVYQKSLLTSELRKRVYSLAQNLAYNSSNYLYINNISITQPLVSGVEREPDIENVFLTDIGGKILASTDTSYTGKKIAIPAGIDSTAIGKWFPAENSSIKRMITPIEIAVSKEDSVHERIASSKGNYSFQHKISISFTFPRFSASSDEITFTALVGGAVRPETSAIMSLSLRNRRLRTLVAAGSNGFLSNNEIGRAHV
jgi:hypothetical protein